MTIIGANGASRRPLITSEPAKPQVVGAEQMAKGFTDALAARAVESVVIACTFPPGGVGKANMSTSAKLTIQQAIAAAKALREAADQLEAPAAKTGGA